MDMGRAKKRVGLQGDGICVAHAPVWALSLLAVAASCPTALGLATIQQSAPAPQQSRPSTTSGAVEKATPPLAEDAPRKPKLQVPAGNAIPEEPAPVLLDGPTTQTVIPANGVDDPAVMREFAGLIGEGKFQDVEPRLVEYLKASPSSSQAHYFYGYVLFRQMRLGDSIRELAKSLELDSENAESHKILSRALSVLGRYDLALRELNEAERLMPNSAEIPYNRGRIYSIQDDFHRARAEFEAALRLNPNYMEAHNALGFALEALGDDPAALESYQKAVQLSEQHGAKFEAPYVNLSGYYGRRGEFQTSLDYARKALEFNPNSDLAYYQMAKTYRALEDWPREAEALEKAIAIKPTSSQYHYVLSAAYRKLGKVKESQAALEEFRRIDKQSAELEKQRRETRRSTAPPDPVKSE
jgi:tetratricopeptide (TPR) repeat protein